MDFVLDGMRVLFPFPSMYREQYDYMLELKRALDAPRQSGLSDMSAKLVPGCDQVCHWAPKTLTIMAIGARALTGKETIPISGVWLLRSGN